MKDKRVTCFWSILRHSACNESGRKRINFSLTLVPPVTNVRIASLWLKPSNDLPFTCKKELSENRFSDETDQALIASLNSIFIIVITC